MLKLHSFFRVTGATVLLLSLFSATAKADTFVERFESGSKSNYSTGDVNLSSGLWEFKDAVLGNSSNDAKNGRQSARIRNRGRITMLFDLNTGAGEITVAHARYGSSGNNNWGVWCSTDSGKNWEQIGSANPIHNQTMQTVTFTANIPGKVRCEVAKTGDNTEINIDDIRISPYSASSAAPAPSTPSSSTPSPSNNNNSNSGSSKPQPTPDLKPKIPNVNILDILPF